MSCMTEEGEEGGEVTIAAVITITIVAVAAVAIAARIAVAVIVVVLSRATAEVVAAFGCHGALVRRG